jgi:hypothetical protein
MLSTTKRHLTPTAVKYVPPAVKNQIPLVGLFIGSRSSERMN